MGDKQEHVKEQRASVWVGRHASPSDDVSGYWVHTSPPAEHDGKDGWAWGNDRAVNVCDKVAALIFAELPAPGHYIETTNVNTVTEPERVVEVWEYQYLAGDKCEGGYIIDNHPAAKNVDAWLTGIFHKAKTNRDRTWTSDGRGGGAWDRDAEE